MDTDMTQKGLQKYLKIRTDTQKYLKGNILGNFNGQEKLVEAMKQRCCVSNRSTRFSLASSLEVSLCSNNEATEYGNQTGKNTQHQLTKIGLLQKTSTLANGKVEYRGDCLDTSIQSGLEFDKSVLSKIQVATKEHACILLRQGTDLWFHKIRSNNFL